MKNAVHLNVYKLKKKASVEDFLLAVEKLISEEISKKKGYVSFRLMQDGDTWVDEVTFETMEDLKKFEEEAKKPSEAAKHFYSFINFFARGGKHHKLTVLESFNCPNVVECPCPRTTCPNHKKCCVCVVKHNETDSLPFCQFPDSDGDKSYENLYRKLKERFEK